MVHENPVLHPKPQDPFGWEVVQFILQLLQHSIPYLNLLVSVCCSVFHHSPIRILTRTTYGWHISYIPLARAECNDTLLLLGDSFVPLCDIPSPSTLFHQLVFRPPSPQLAVCFLVYLSALLLPKSHKILLREFYFLPFSVHAHTNVI